MENMKWNSYDISFKAIDEVIKHHCLTKKKK